MQTRGLFPEYSVEKFDYVRCNRTLHRRSHMISLGIVLLLVNLLVGLPVLNTLGLILIIVGVVLVLLGSTGRALGGRKHYW